MFLHAWRYVQSEDSQRLHLSFRTVPLTLRIGILVIDINISGRVVETTVSFEQALLVTQFNNPPFLWVDVSVSNILINPESVVCMDNLYNTCVSLRQTFFRVVLKVRTGWIETFKMNINALVYVYCRFIFIVLLCIPSFLKYFTLESIVKSECKGPKPLCKYVRVT
jgi:hypothetical protein